MNDVIHLLPDSVANQIAAGEVIQRPASVIKELVENAVDAGATEIRIIIRDAGRTLIQVVDNGKGMSETDARMAFERHATSKISAAADLFSLHTMGFRGEALPSICAISTVECRTRTKDQQLGTKLVIIGSNVESQEPDVCEAGTNMMVKNLFFNVPARRKFLKSDSVELANVMREFERLALVNNGIRLSIDTGSRTIDLRAASFKQRIHDIWKNNLNMQLLPVDVETSLVKISGFVSRPEFARRRNALQYLFVNGRNMRHPYFRRAILSCFEDLVAPGTEPCFFIRFEVDPQSIDVNIHPTKNEIKFENEQEIWPILVAAVKATLGKNGAVPSIDFNSDALPMQPLREGEKPAEPKLEMPEGYNPFTRYSGPDISATVQQRRPVGSQYRPTQQTRNWDTLYNAFMRQAGESAGETAARSETPSLPIDDEPRQDVAPICFQHDLKYLITSTNEGLVIIDQHRAHVKILYERYRRMAGNNQSASQQVMFPESLYLDPVHEAALTEVEADLHSLGFVLRHTEGEEWLIDAVPSVLTKDSPSDLILRILDSVLNDSGSYGSEQDASRALHDRILLLMARSAAIQRGARLSQSEMEHLVGSLFSLPDPALTPDGNKIYIVADEHTLTRMFS